MFTYDFVNGNSVGNRVSQEEAFYNFLLTIKVRKEEYPFSFESKASYKGRSPQYKAVSWGGYFNADNEWVLFIAYRCPSPDHTIQHSWSWDAENECAINHRTFDFRN